MARGEEGLDFGDHAGVSGAAMPFVLVILLNTYGYIPTLRAFAVASVESNGLVLSFLKGRLPASQSCVIDMGFQQKRLS